MAEFLEIMMLVLFGCSWPLSVIKSYKARTTKGKSILFVIFILIGYVCGICAKLISGNFHWYVLFFYCLNFTMVFLDFLLYFRNLSLDKKAEKLE